MPCCGGRTSHPRPFFRVSCTSPRITASPRSLRHVYALHGYPVGKELLLGLGRRRGIHLLAHEGHAALHRRPRQPRASRRGRARKDRRPAHRCAGQLLSHGQRSQAPKGAPGRAGCGPASHARAGHGLPALLRLRRARSITSVTMWSSPADTTRKTARCCWRIGTRRCTPFRWPRSRRRARFNLQALSAAPRLVHVRFQPVASSRAGDILAHRRMRRGCWSRPSPISASRAFARRLDAFKPGGTPWARTTCATCANIAIMIDARGGARAGAVSDDVRPLPR